MNRSDFIDSDKFKEKLKNPSVAIGQRWSANKFHDFGNGPTAYAIRVFMKEPLGDRWLVNYHLESGGQIPNGYNNNGALTDSQIKENFTFIITPPAPPQPQFLPMLQVSGTIAMNGFNGFNTVAPNFIQGT